MWAFNVELDRQRPAYIRLSTACLHSYLRALEDIRKRDEGITVETPPLALPDAAMTTADGGTLLDALDGWKKHRARPKRTVDEFGRSVDMFIQLHGNMPVAAIKKKHALEYRKALQDVPRHRTGDLLRAPLPAQAAWGREHPEELRITAATINKQLDGVQSICIWASDNGLVSDNVQWIDPFSKLRLPEERSERTSFKTAELQKLFSAPVHRASISVRCSWGRWLLVTGGASRIVSDAAGRPRLELALLGIEPEIEQTEYSPLTAPIRRSRQYQIDHVQYAGSNEPSEGPRGVHLFG
ncbi:hypothetical protein ACVWZ4_001891 [Bradyrhizobium sp. USDA 4472]